MTEPVIPEPGEVIESITPSPLAKYLLIGVIGVAGGIALGYLVAKVLEEDRVGHYQPGVSGDYADALEAEVEEPEDEVETEPVDVAEPPNVNVAE